MRKAFFIIPKGRRLAASLHAVTHSITFETHIWRKGIPDPDYENWDWGIKLSMAAAPNPPETHLMLWGKVDNVQVAILNSFSQDLPGAKVYYENDGWTRWSVMADMGLTEMPQLFEGWEI